MPIHRSQFTTELCSIQRTAGMSKTKPAAPGRTFSKASDVLSKRRIRSQEQLLQEEVSYISQKRH